MNVSKEPQYCKGCNASRPFSYLDCVNVEGDSDCEEWKTNGWCTSYSAYMEKNCQKACSYCGGTHSDYQNCFYHKS